MNIFIRRIWRLLRLALHIGVGLFQASVLFGFYSAAAKDQIVSRWSGKLLRILSIRLDVPESPAFDQGALLVANHISWLDIFVILSVKRVHFVAKHEIRSWPVFGWLAHRAGTLFIQRARKSDTVRINQAMHDLLQDGAWVAVFPEGTSTNGSRLLRFLSSLFQPAVTENLPVVPAALQYRTADGQFTDAAAYADNISFGQSLWSITGEKEICVRLQFCTPILGHDRRELAEMAYQEIATCLGFVPTGTPPGSPCGLPAAMP